MVEEILMILRAYGPRGLWGYEISMSLSKVGCEQQRLLCFVTLGEMTRDGLIVWDNVEGYMLPEEAR